MSSKFASMKFRESLSNMILTGLSLCLTSLTCPCGPSVLGYFTLSQSYIKMQEAHVD